MPKLLLVAGPRFNFMKMAPIVRALNKGYGVQGSTFKGPGSTAERQAAIMDRATGSLDGFSDRMDQVHAMRLRQDHAPASNAEPRTLNVTWKLVHTGRCYDGRRSQVFLDGLGIPAPDYYLNDGSGAHAEQTAKVMLAFENICVEERPDVVAVVGDVNSSLACSIVAKKAGVKVAHVEAGLRNRDMAMPEQINRIVTDSISDYLFVTERAGVHNLMREGRPKESIFFVGPVMVDNFYYQLEKLEEIDLAGLSTYPVKEKLGQYVFLTLHRPSNVDDPVILRGITGALNNISADLPILFPVHPRTMARIRDFDIHLSRDVVLLPPLGFSESLFLWKDAKLVITDSGRLQEETTALGVPCFTVRENTERPVTIEQGTNTLVSTSGKAMLKAWQDFRNGKWKTGSVPELWDGHAAERIVEILRRQF